MVASHSSVLAVDYSAASVVPTVTLSDAVVTEGGRGAIRYATITVTLSEASTQRVSIGYRTQAVTATGSGSTRDFVPASGTLTLKAGQTTGTIRVRIIGDTRVEPDEVFNVVVTRLKNASLASSSSGQSFGRVVIQDDDSATRTRPTLSISSPTVLEGGSAGFIVSLSSPASQAVTVKYYTQPGTASTSRFTSVAGILTIPAGQTSAIIRVATNADGIVEDYQQFSVKLSAAANAEIGSDTGTATLIDGDSTPSISVASASVTESDTITRKAIFTVTLSAASSKPVTVKYSTANGTAIAGSDYQATSGTLTFAPGVTSLTIPVTIVNDTVYESVETFSLVLSEAVNATISQGTATGTIHDNDDAPTASITGVTKNEGASGELTAFTFTVTLSAASGTTGTVDYSTDDATAIAGLDYQAMSGTLTFAPGETTKTFTVYVVGNDTYENTKLFIVNLSNPNKLRLIAATSAANGTILNDDAPPESS